MRQVIAEDYITLPLSTAPATPDDKATLAISIQFTTPDAGQPLQLQLTGQPELAGALLDNFGLALAHRGQLASARTCIDAALQLRQQHFGQDHPDTAASCNSLGHVLRQTGQFEAARAEVNKAMAINTRVYGAQSLPVALNLNELAVIEVQLGAFTAAEQAAASAMNILQALRLQEVDYNVTRIQDTQARIQQVRGNYQQAADLYRHLLAMDLKQVGRNSLKYASHQVNYATVLAAAGNTGEAMQELKAATDWMEQDTPHHPDYLDALSNLASLYLQCGECDKARETLNTVIERERQARSPSHPYVGNDHARLGRLEYQLQQYAAAATAFRDALSIYEQSVRQGQLPPRHTFIAEANTWLARTLVETAAGTSESPAREAEALTRAALLDWKVELGERSVEYAIANAVLGRALFLQDPASQEARDRLNAAYPMVVASRGVDAPVAALIKRWLDEAGGGRPASAPAAPDALAVSLS